MVVVLLYRGDFASVLYHRYCPEVTIGRALEDRESTPSLGARLKQDRTRVGVG